MKKAEEEIIEWHRTQDQRNMCDRHKTFYSKPEAEEYAKEVRRLQPCSGYHDVWIRKKWFKEIYTVYSSEEGI